MRQMLQPPAARHPFRELSRRASPGPRCRAPSCGDAYALPARGHHVLPQNVGQQEVVAGGAASTIS